MADEVEPSGHGSASDSEQEFTLLLPVWRGDRADYLETAFRSTVDEQTRPPAQVVLVQDGPVDPAVTETIDRLCRTSPVHVDVVRLDRNIGLGPALDAGLNASKHEIVARMDADDISLPHRFAVQLPVIENGADIVGSGLLEFGEHPEDIVGQRVPPIRPEDIRRRARFADPFNHPTVVYRRSAVEAVGGYRDLPLMEDYLLFAKMIDAHVQVANIAEPLVMYRVGAGAYARRGGMPLLRTELAIQRRFRDLGFTTRWQYLRNVALRGGYRLVPERLRKVAYRTFIAAYGERHRG